MKSEKRQFIHEYSEHFGVESVAYDAEPNRNVVATAYKDKVKKIFIIFFRFKNIPLDTQIYLIQT